MVEISRVSLEYLINIKNKYFSLYHKSFLNYSKIPCAFHVCKTKYRFLSSFCAVATLRVPRISSFHIFGGFLWTYHLFHSFLHSSNHLNLLIEINLLINKDLWNSDCFKKLGTVDRHAITMVWWFFKDYTTILSWLSQDVCIGKFQLKSI